MNRKKMNMSKTTKLLLLLQESHVWACRVPAQAQDELQLLERVFLRLGNAETDEQLQEAVSKFLPPVLLKLTSQNEGVRKKVMELLVHINKRIKNNTAIQLPVEALLLQYQDPAATRFVINFTITYLKMGPPRLLLVHQRQSWCRACWPGSRPSPRCTRTLCS